jgi:hypothetical protein
MFKISPLAAAKGLSAICQPCADDADRRLIILVASHSPFRGKQARLIAPMMQTGG